MDLTKNRILDGVKKIHLIAACGTGMGALAAMLKDMRYQVTGSDQNVYPPISTFLMEKGIFVADGFSGENISYGPDLVVVGNTVKKDNPEVKKLDEMGLHYCSMPQALNRFVAGGKKPILIAGTHGKTTTSSIMAWVLFCAGLDPSFFIGGILKDFNSNYRLGNDEYMVIEGDEYDTAFFDKGPKFLHYTPSVAILTSVEFDHADIFKDVEHVKTAFRSFVAGIPPKNTLFAFDGDENVSELIRDSQCRVVKYGGSKDSDWRLGAVSIEPPWTKFEVLRQGRAYGTFKTKLVGEHNLFNALSVIAASDSMKVPAAAVEEALASFSGIRRRQEVRGEKRGITVMDDFAHHPTAVKETLRAVKPFCTSGRLVAVFEPRTNSSRRSVFQNIYPLVFDPADLVCIRKPPMLDGIPESERFSSEKLVDDLKRRGKDAHFFSDTDAVIDFLVKTARSGDLILIMSNGGFDNIHERLLKRL